MEDYIIDMEISPSKKRKVDSQLQNSTEKSTSTPLSSALDQKLTSKSLDLNNKVETDFSMFIVKAFSKETATTTTTKKKSASAGEMPSEAEMEDFFTAAEKYEKNRFIEKYNYDIVKDVPLEGRYEWVKF